MSIRAKFQCESKEHDTIDPSHGNVTLRAVYAGSEENEKFFNLTPAASISLATLNPEAFAQFEPGKQYYVDFTQAEEAVESEIVG
ncbi:MAG: hypothetical protein DCF22_00500 [Leptolyngbya sp.]|nr:MAG: hypothetical protein DCF22_00500 [Leptolyngbya sp.]